MSSKSTPSPNRLRRIAESLSPECHQIAYCVGGKSVRDWIWTLYDGEGWLAVLSWQEKALLCLFFAEAIEQGDL